MAGLQELVASHKRKKDEEKWMIRTHHRLMKAYGWIPFDEFKKLPLSTVNNLINEINEEPNYIQVVIVGMSKKMRGRR